MLDKTGVGFSRGVAEPVGGRGKEVKVGASGRCETIESGAW